MSAYLVPLAADIGALLIYFLCLPLLVDCFQQKTPANALVVLAAYLFFCLSVYALRRLEPQIESSDHRAWLGFFGVFLGLIVIFMVEDLTGALNDVDALSKLGETAGGALLPIFGILVLLVMFLYPALLWLDITPWDSVGRNTEISIRLFGLTGVNFMVLVTVAHWQVYFQDTEPYEDLTWGAKILIFAVVYLFFLLFYAPPRLFLVFRGVSWLSMGTFLLQTGLYVWRSLYSGRF